MFATGLVISGMSMPSKVLGFLDVTGAWDPSLMFVMLGAIAVFCPSYRLIVRRTRPLFDDTMHLPTKTKLDARLLIGAAIFGIGWGLVGLCPGPALTAMGTGAPQALAFLLAMLSGMALIRPWV